MLCAGAVRKKNVQNTMLKNLLDACGAALAFWAVGYAFAFGGQDFESSTKTFIGTENFFLMGVDDLAFWLFQYAFSAASATIVAGTLAERCQMAAYLCYSVVLGGFVYPVIAHSIWNPQGFLSANAVEPLLGVGMIDFAGSGVVHLTGGTTALFATMILGPRRGRFHDDTGRKLDKPKEFPGHSVALQVRLLLFAVSHVRPASVVLTYETSRFSSHSSLSIFHNTDAWNFYAMVWVVRVQRRVGTFAPHSAWCFPKPHLPTPDVSHWFDALFLLLLGLAI